MKISFRLTNELLTQIHGNLSRPHPFAAERVGFIACSAANGPDGGLIFLAQTFHPRSEEHTSELQSH